MTDKATLAALPFEKALAELEDIVRRLERGDVPLEDSIAIYERGEALKKHCEALLKKAEARIEKITIGPDGQGLFKGQSGKRRSIGAGHRGPFVGCSLLCDRGRSLATPRSRGIRPPVESGGACGAGTTIRPVF